MDSKGFEAAEIPYTNDVSNISCDVNMDLKEFHLFPKLSPEIRLMIWKHAVEHAINQPRFLQIYTCLDRSYHNGCLIAASTNKIASEAWHVNSISAQYHIRRPSQKSPMSSLLSTNHESAHEMRNACKSKSISCSSFTQPLLPRYIETAIFNFNLDTLAVPYKILRPIITPYGRTTFTGFERVKKLLLLQTQGYFLHALHEPREVARNLVKFSSLKELFIENSNHPPGGFVKGMKTFEEVEWRSMYSFSHYYYGGNLDRSIGQIKEERGILGGKEIEKIVVVGVVRERIPEYKFLC